MALQWMIVLCQHFRASDQSQEFRVRLLLVFESKMRLPDQVCLAIDEYEDKYNVWY